MVLIVAGIVVMALVSGAYALDRQARRRRKRLGGPAEMAGDVRAGNQGAHVIDSARERLQTDVSLTDLRRVRRR
jgi:hypothetical protein